MFEIAVFSPVGKIQDFIKRLFLFVIPVKSGID